MLTAIIIENFKGIKDPVFDLEEEPFELVGRKCLLSEDAMLK